MQATLDSEGQFVDFTINEDQVRIGLRPKTDDHNSEIESEENEGFTTEMSSGDESSGSDSSEKDSLVFTLVKKVGKNNYVMGVPSDENKNDKMIEEKLSHLQEDVKKGVRKDLTSTGVSAWSLDDLKNTDVPVKHHFELKDNLPI